MTIYRGLRTPSHGPLDPKASPLALKKPTSSMAALRLPASLICIILGFSATAIAADVAGAEQRLIPFDEFIASVVSAPSVPPVDGAVAPASTLPSLKSYLNGLYAGVDAKAVKHSFVDDNGTAFDCIPMSQQPALRGSAGPLPTAPDIPGTAQVAASADDGQDLVRTLWPDDIDRFGNATVCPTSTIPMARVTLEELARFPSLDAFFSKDGKALGADQTLAAQPSVAATHRYAHAYQFTNNLGGHSYLNFWDPGIGANQVFSLSQHWYVAGTGNNLQTAEVGVQIFPQSYGTTKPVFFTYWTADAYQRTGCYNLTCPAFVQTNRSWALGGAISPWSTPNGAQYELEITYYLYQGNWWLYVNGTSAANAIGYYPGTIYNGGALTKGATEIDYGGEVVGTISWPPMGSGKFAKKGYGKSAYHRAIYYFSMTGTKTNANLTVDQQWPWDYTATVTTYASPWNETLFFGGPGGNS